MAEPRDLCTLEEVRATLPLKAGQDDPNALISRLITSVSAEFRRRTGREIVSRDATWADPGPPVDEAAGITIPSTTRTFYRRAGERSVRIGDLFEVDSILADGVDIEPVVELGPADRDPGLEPITTLQFLTGDGHAWTRLSGYPRVAIAITGKWGFPEIPADVREAAIAEVVLRYKRLNQRRSETQQLVEGAPAPTRNVLADEFASAVTSYRPVGPVFV